MSVKVGNLVTDEKNVKEVLSVEDGEQMMNALGVGDVSKNTIVSNNSNGFAILNDGKCFVSFESDSVGSTIKGIYFDDTGIKAFEFEKSSLNVYSPATSN